MIDITYPRPYAYECVFMRVYPCYRQYSCSVRNVFIFGTIQNDTFLAELLTAVACPSQLAWLSSG